MISTKCIKEIGRLWHQLLFRDSGYNFSSLYSLCLVQKTHVLFKYEKKVAIEKKSKDKSLDLTDNTKEVWYFCLLQIGGLKW